MIISAHNFIKIMAVWLSVAISWGLMCKYKPHILSYFLLGDKMINTDWLVKSVVSAVHWEPTGSFNGNVLLFKVEVQLVIIFIFSDTPFNTGQNID